MHNTQLSECVTGQNTAKLVSKTALARWSHSKVTPAYLYRVLCAIRME